MKLNFKTLLIIFLVAALGAGVGTFATSEIINQYTTRRIGPSNVVTNVEYNKIEPTNFEEAVAKAYQTVVEIRCTTNNGYYSSSSAGSGVIISSDGYIITNNHVVSGTSSITVIFPDNTSYEAELIGTDLRSDIGVVKIEASNLPYANFVDSENTHLGQTVIAIGNPLGEGIAVSDGIIASLSKEVTINSVSMDLLQTTAAINEGNSGGGLFDLNGNIVGIVNAKSSSSGISATVEGMGYAIPANTAKTIVSDLIEYGFVKNRATLGIRVYTQQSSSLSSFFFGFGNTNTQPGLLISEILEGGAADEAGLEAGDYIIAVDDMPVNSYTDLIKILDKYNVGDEVKVEVTRNQETKIFNATLTEATN